MHSAKQHLEQNYPDIGEALGIQKLAHTNVNSVNYLVKTEQGSFVLKELQGSVNRSQTEALAKILTHCSHNGVRVPEPVLNSSNNYGGTAGRHLLTRFCDGEPFEGTTAQLKDAAKQIAHLHKTLAASEISYEWAPDAQFYEHLSKEEIVKLRSLAQKNASVFDDSVMDHLGLLELLYGECKKAKADPSPEQLIHCDLQPGNLLFVGDKISAILDLGMMRIGNIRQDIAFAAFRLALSQKGDIRKEVETFTRSYIKYNNVDGIDFELLKSWFTCHTLSRVSYILKKYYWGNSEEWIQDFEKQIGFLKKVQPIT
jgi:Ser/Thr protein kinase RdoA (MazF antagonist)